MRAILISIAIILVSRSTMQSQIASRISHVEAANVNKTFPRIASKDLAGKSVTLPTDFPGERTIVIVAFTREQQHDIDGWVSGLHLDSGKLPWLELPVIENPGAIVRAFIDSGMRRGISNHETWKHVVTLYTGKAEFKAALGITSETCVYTMVVDRQGTIFQIVPGPFTSGGGESIQAAVEEGRSTER